MSASIAKRGEPTSGIDLLRRATSPRKTSKRSSPKNTKWKRKVDNKLRGSYGQTDYVNKTITINKKASKKDPLYKRPVNKGAKKYPDVLATMVHEEYHRAHPKATERTTRKAERKLVASMTPTQKRRMYGRYQKKAA